MVALAAVVLHVCIGSVYAWSVLTGPIITATGWSLTEVTFTFSIAILFLGTSAAMLGARVERWGPSKSARISACFFALGLVGGGFAITVHSLPLLYLTYGVLGGIGLGVGYIAPVSTLVKWFPRHRGFATGLVIMGFGFASFVAGPLLRTITDVHGVVYAMVTVGLAYGLLMTYVSQFIVPPVGGKSAHGRRQVQSASTTEACHTRWFALLWVVFFINIASGISFLAIASPMAQATVGMTAAQAAVFVGVVGLVNGGGRIAWASISDIVGARYVYVMLFVIEAVAFALVTSTHDVFIFQFLVMLIVACYGGGFACMPAYLSDIFGSDHLSAIHGRILTAWGAAGVVGPLFVAYRHELTGTYSLTPFALAFIVSAVIACYLATKAPRGH